MYVKQTWATGDTITADKLNHMEDGIGVRMFVEAEVLEASPYMQLDATAGDIIDAIDAGIPVYIVDNDGYFQQDTAGKYLILGYCSKEVESVVTGSIYYATSTAGELLFDSIDDHPHPYVD